MIVESLSRLKRCVLHFKKNNHRLNSTSFLIKNLKFEDSKKILNLVLVPIHLGYLFQRQKFFLNERPFRRLHLEVRRGSFGFLNHEKIHNKLNRSCKICNLKELQFNRTGLHRLTIKCSIPIQRTALLLNLEKSRPLRLETLDFWFYNFHFSF